MNPISADAMDAMADHSPQFKPKIPCNLLTPMLFSQNKNGYWLVVVAVIWLACSWVINIGTHVFTSSFVYVPSW